MSTRAFCGGALGAVLVGASTLAYATPPRPAPPMPTRTAKLKPQGDQAMIDKRYEDALAVYDAALTAEPDPVLFYNRGRALQFLARYPEALASLRRFRDEAPADVRGRVPTLGNVVAEVQAKVAILRVKTGASGARVLLAGRDLGAAPVTAPVPVSSGKARLEVLADGYLPYARDVNLPGDEALTEINVRLASRSTEGLVVVKSAVAGARVSIDDRAVGDVPAECALPAGTHKLRVEREGYDVAITQIIVTAGDRREVTVDPIPRPPLYARWWLWTAVGLAAAGAVVTGVALTTERKPPIGTFQPGIVRF